MTRLGEAEEFYDQPCADTLLLLECRIEFLIRDWTARFVYLGLVARSLDSYLEHLYIVLVWIRFLGFGFFAPGQVSSSYVPEYIMYPWRDLASDLTRQPDHLKLVL